MVLLVLLLQLPACSSDAAGLMAQARDRVEAFDVPGAAAPLKKAAALGCGDAAVALAYLTGLQAARDAYRVGGDEESLAPVLAAQTTLAAYAAQGRGQAEIARVVLMAGAAAAQSERDDLGVFLAHALQLETTQLSLGAVGAPVLSAHEAAGDLWLQVHRFETARAAYRTAAEVVGTSPRIMLGLARTSARLDDRMSACDWYARLVTWWGTRAPVAEITEARTYLNSATCGRGNAAAGR